MVRRAVLPALFLLLAGCVYYPTVMDTGGVRIRTENGRAVRQADGILVTFDVSSSGKYGDVLVGVSSPVARQARLVSGAGAPITRMEIPGAVTVRFTPESTHVVLADLARPLAPGETFIVTLMFEKSGGIGIVTLLQ
jgi:copper(I)-binding protein